MKSVLYSLNGMVLDLLFPEKCLGCNLKGSILCKTCISSFTPCTREPTDDIYAPFNYHDPILKKAIWNLKYYKRKTLGRTLGKALFSSLCEEISEIKGHSPDFPIYIIPVPLSFRRKKERGYNQAERIARGFCESLPDDTYSLKLNVIAKKKNTLAQAKITNRESRLLNISNTFILQKPHEIQGKTIIVIDDVTTTGGTLLEIMKVLKNGGAKKVIGCALAH